MLKIDRVQTYILKVPLARPVADSIYYRTHWHVPVVEIYTSDGLMGTGYSGVWAGEALLCQTIDQYIQPILLDGAPLISTLEDAATSARIIHAAYRAARQQRAVSRFADGHEHW